MPKFLEMRAGSSRLKVRSIEMEGFVRIEVREGGGEKTLLTRRCCLPAM